MIQEREYNRYTGGYGKDYSNLNNNPTGTYPSRTDDGNVTAKVVLPTWGEMYTGNDLNINYWYINRWNNSESSLSKSDAAGGGNGIWAGHTEYSIRPVVTLKSEVKIKDGEGTMTNPYSLYM